MFIAYSSLVISAVALFCGMLASLMWSFPNQYSQAVHKTALVVDHDHESSSRLGQALSTAGINCIVVENALGMWQELSSSPDVLILDISLPSTDGLGVLRKVRERSSIPILIRSARLSKDEHITGIEIGADDFLPKPCSLPELVVRVKSLLRRSQRKNVTPPTAFSYFQFGDWVLNETLRELTNNRGERIPLGGAFFALLSEFIQHPLELLSREQLTPVFKRKYDPEDRIVDVYISQIRRILGKQTNGRSYIETMRGKGYVFTAPVSLISDYLP